MPNKDWKSFLDEQMALPYGRTLKAFLKQERARYSVYPPADATLAAFKLTPFESTKAVILGQDPYHGPGQAMGLCFSVPPTQPIPPSLDNILKEYSSDLVKARPNSGDLTKWALQGVLLLNTTLTVREHAPMSHSAIGWEELTRAAVIKISEELSDIVFILWGKHAAALKTVINTDKHHVLMAPHPSPLSAYRGFFGSKPFSKTNEILISRSKEPIDWELN